MELAALLFAGISATMSAIQVWQNSRNSEAAAAAFDTAMSELKSSDQAIEAGEELSNIVPEETIEALESRAEKCWTRYNTVLSGGFLPDEIDEATDSVKLCICRELGRIHSINGGNIPDRWRPNWDSYQCQAVGYGANSKDEGGGTATA